MQEKQVNVKTMCEMSDKELAGLLDGLRMLKGFDFFIDSQFVVRNKVKEEKKG